MKKGMIILPGGRVAGGARVAYWSREGPFFVPTYPSPKIPDLRVLLASFGPA